MAQVAQVVVEVTQQNYRETVSKMTRPLSDDEKKIEMMAMFLCDSGIVSLAGNGEGRLSGGHGWHRTNTQEQVLYREQARLAIGALTTRHIGVT